MEDSTYTQVAYDVCRNGTIMVSTIWVGMDMSFGGLTAPRPLMFETMAFPRASDGSRFDLRRGLLQWRYGDEATAKAGHSLAVVYCTHCADDEIDNIDEATLPEVVSA